MIKTIGLGVKLSLVLLLALLSIVRIEAQLMKTAELIEQRQDQQQQEQEQNSKNSNPILGGNYFKRQQQLLNFGPEIAALIQANRQQARFQRSLGNSNQLSQLPSQQQIDDEQLLKRQLPVSTLDSLLEGSRRLLSNNNKTYSSTLLEFDNN